MRGASKIQVVTLLLAFGAIFGGGTQAQAADLDRTVAFNIESQPLEKALVLFSQQADIQVVLNTGPMGGADAASLKDTVSAREGLERLLNGTGFRYAPIGVRTVSVMRADGNSDRGFIRAAGVDSASSAVSAQSSSPATGEGADEDKSRVQEIIVTAQKRKENLQDVPIAITVLSGEKLDASTFANFNDALRTIPGFDNNVDGLTGGLTLSARGVSNSTPRGSGAGTVAYYIDGTPYGFVRNSFYPGGGDVYDLERIEFLAGPQGTLYGANALNGVLRILTNDPEVDRVAFKGRVISSGTSGGDWNYSGDMAANVPLIEGKLALRAVAGYRNDSGWIDIRNTQRPDLNRDNVNDKESNYYRVKLKLQATETLSLGLSVWHSEFDFGAQDQSDDAKRKTVVQDESGSQEFTTYGAEIEQEFPTFTLSSSTSYMKFRAAGFLSGAPVGAGFVFDTRPTAQLFAQELNLISTLSGPWRWSAGLFYKDAEDVSYQKQIRFVAPLTESWADDYTDRSKSWAVYGEIGRSFFDDKLNLSAGLRSFHDKQELSLNSQYFVPPLLGSPFESKSEALTPRAVATWKLSNAATIYASYSQGFRSGFAQRPELQRLYPDYKPVEPDKLTNYEIGSKGTLFGSAIIYTAALFYVDWQDLQQSLGIVLPDGQTGTAAVINANSASGLGAEASLSVQPIEGLRISGNVSWNELKFDSNVISNNAVTFRKGDRTLLSPEYTIGGEAEYSWKMNSDLVGRISWGGDYKSPQNTVRNGVASTSKRYYQQRASLMFEDSDGWVITVFADNLTNDYYAPTPRLSPAEWQLRLRPRTIGLKVDFRY